MTGIPETVDIAEELVIALHLEPELDDALLDRVVEVAEQCDERERGRLVTAFWKRMRHDAGLDPTEMTPVSVLAAERLAYREAMGKAA